MDVLFFDYGGDNRVVDKPINDSEPLARVTGAKPFEPLSPLTGQLLLAYDPAVYAANYAKFENKYYFITDRELLTGGRMRLICKIDVLMSYNLSNVEVVPVRSASSYNDYIIDPTQPAETRVQTYNLLFSGDNLDYNNMTMIAGIVGTGGTPTDF